MTIAHAPLVIDVDGLALNDDDRRRLRHPMTGGLILFRRNWQDRRQLTELTTEAKSIRPDLVVCVDHEGGRVQRFRSDGFTHLSPMRALGELWMRDAMRATDAATAAGYVLGAELRACVVDFSFTPVLDLDHRRSAINSHWRRSASAAIITSMQGDDDGDYPYSAPQDPLCRPSGRARTHLVRRAA